MSITIGDILGDYQVTGVLGRGGMGKVFRVRSLITDREEAMKIVLPDLEERPELADRFLREIKVHASLRHPNIAALHTALRIGDRLVMTLELVEGVSLEEKLRAGFLGVPTAVNYALQALSALGYAHEHGVIHRDIKPANILIATDGAVKLTDFGIARSSTAQRLTGTGLAVGTLAYMSPEQIRSGQVDARSDLYSFGLTFYEMVTGRRAIHGDTEHALMTAQLNLIPIEPCMVNSMVPPGISAAIMRALQKDPERRFQTASEFEGALKDPSRLPAVPPVASNTFAAHELTEIEAHLSRAIGPIAKRLVSDAAKHCKTLPEIRATLAAQIDDPKRREVFLKTDPGATVALQSPSSGTSTFDPATLDRLAQALTPYLGPIARVMVNRTARSVRTATELHETLAAEIASPDDRRRFLAAVRSLS